MNLSISIRLPLPGSSSFLVLTYLPSFFTVLPNMLDTSFAVKFPLIKSNTYIVSPSNPVSTPLVSSHSLLPPRFAFAAKSQYLSFGRSSGISDFGIMQSGNPVRSS